MLSDDTKR